MTVRQLRVSAWVNAHWRSVCVLSNGGGSVGPLGGGGGGGDGGPKSLVSAGGGGIGSSLRWQVVGDVASRRSS